ncbi:Fkbp-type peptidylprolyl cis-trans isomerase, partial [Globisporangium splendens]
MNDTETTDVCDITHLCCQQYFTAIESIMAKGNKNSNQNKSAAPAPAEKKAAPKTQEVVAVPGFFGHVVAPGQTLQWANEVEEFVLQLNSAALDAKAVTGRSTLYVLAKESKIALCTLSTEGKEQWSLNQTFTPLDGEIAFVVEGANAIHLTGFIEVQDDEDDDDEHDYDGYCESHDGEHPDDDGSDSMDDDEEMMVFGDQSDSDDEEEDEEEDSEGRFEVIEERVHGDARAKKEAKKEASPATTKAAAKKGAAPAPAKKEAAKKGASPAPAKKEAAAAPAKETPSKNDKKVAEKIAELTAASNANKKRPAPSESQDVPKKAKNSRLYKGVTIEEHAVGKGQVVQKGRKVSILYKGRLENGKQFDANQNRKKPFSFRHGIGDVIKGMDIGIEGMRSGGKRTILIPSKLGIYNGSREDERVQIVALALLLPQEQRALVADVELLDLASGALEQHVMQETTACGATSRRALGLRGYAAWASVRGVQWLARWLPERELLRGATVLGYFFYYVVQYRWEVVETRLATALPHVDAAERRRIARNAYVNLGLSLLWFLRLPPSSVSGRRHAIDELIDVEGSESLFEGNAIVTTGHVGTAMAHVGIPSVGVLEPTMRAVDRLSASASTDGECVGQRHAAWQPATPCSSVNTASSPSQQIVGIVADQRAKDPNTRVGVRFLGQRTYFPSGAARLHLHAPNATLLFATLLHNHDFYRSPASAASTKPFRLHVRQVRSSQFMTGKALNPVLLITISILAIAISQISYPRLESDESPQTVVDQVTQMYADLLQEVVLQHPEQYLWMHDLWKE